MTGAALVTAAYGTLGLSLGAMVIVRWRTHRTLQMVVTTLWVLFIWRIAARYWVDFGRHDVWRVDDWLVNAWVIAVQVFALSVATLVMAWDEWERR